MYDLVIVDIHQPHASWLVNALNSYQRTDNDNGWHTRVLAALVDAGLAVPVFFSDGRTLGDVQATDDAQAAAMIEFFGLDLPKSSKIQIGHYDAAQFVEYLHYLLSKYQAEIAKDLMASHAEILTIVSAYIKDILDSFVASKHASVSIDHKGQIDYYNIWLADSPAMHWVRDHIKPDNVNKFFPY